MPEPSTKSPKAYQFMFVLYPESQQNAIDYIQANWPCAWALHDKDTHTEQEFIDYGKHHDGNCPDWQIGGPQKTALSLRRKIQKCPLHNGRCKRDSQALRHQRCRYQKVLQPL